MYKYISVEIHTNLTETCGNIFGILSQACLNPCGYSWTPSRSLAVLSYSIFCINQQYFCSAFKRLKELVLKRYHINVWMYECMNVWTYERMNVWTYERMKVWMYESMYEWMYVWMYECMNVWMYVCMYVRTYVPTYVCMYVCTYVCTYVTSCPVMSCNVMWCDVR